MARYVKKAPNVNCMNCFQKRDKHKFDLAWAIKWGIEDYQCPVGTDKKHGYYSAVMFVPVTDATTLQYLERKHWYKGGTATFALRPVK